LGLALTKRLVEMHGGQIHVQSEGIEGLGSVFTFAIPLRKPDDRPVRTAAKAEVKEDALRPHILLLSNQNSDRQWVGEYLSSAGYDVSTLPERQSLADALKARKPYAVVAHAENPPAAGDEALRECRSRIPAQIPFVIFSINGQDMPEFRLFNGDSRAHEPAARLMDAIRGSKKTNGKELKTVLIVDDEPALLELLGLTLVKKGFRVLRAADGRAGMESARKYAPDIIILDLTLPEMGGKQMIEELRADPRTKSIPIVVHTGTVLDEAQRHSLAERVQSITLKSEQDTLFAELERLETLADQPMELEIRL
jgi:DNA-binding response OmpR family regulator